MLLILCGVAGYLPAWSGDQVENWLVHVRTYVHFYLAACMYVRMCKSYMYKKPKIHSQIVLDVQNTYVRTYIRIGIGGIK